MQIGVSRLSRTIATRVAACVLAGASSAAVLAGEEHSVARQWNELLLEGIRNDNARPPVHARNLFHMSAAMYDAWALYDLEARGFLVDGAIYEEDREAAQNEAISYAALRILEARFAKTPGADTVLPLFRQQMVDLGYDPFFFGTVGNSPRAWGNRIALSYLWFGSTDRSNEIGDFANLWYEPVNEPVAVDSVGNDALTFPNRWQPLAFETFIDQSGNEIPGGAPEFLGAEWGHVTPFAIQPSDITIYERDGHEWFVPFDPGPPPLLGTKREEEYRENFLQVLVWSSHLDPDEALEPWDISPASRGNVAIPETPEEVAAFYDFFDGGDASTGYDVNPVTGKPYAPNLVPRADFARVLAEFWADGPDSETPPGHWFAVMNEVMDQPTFERRIRGEGPLVDALEYDVKAYFAMGGAMHDSAVASWGIKGWYDFVRPISVIRWLCTLGQRTDKSLPGYHPEGIDLIPGLIEVITPETTGPKGHHAHLAGEEGRIAVRAWRGPDFIEDPTTDVAGVGWILGEGWWPYQRPTFVTPPFAGYVSGHSTYSRAAAEVLTLMTGSPYFPGGLGEFHCPADDYLVFEKGPSVDVTLQWASYYDAADQSALSRIWGGIHPPADDIPGRRVGAIVGPRAFEFAAEYWGEPNECPWDITRDGVIDGQDLLEVLSSWGECGLCAADVSGDGEVDGVDLANVIVRYGPACP